MYIITIAHPFSFPLLLSHSLFLLTYTHTHVACTYIYQNGWRVTRCLPVICMNQSCRESARRSRITHISAFPYAVPRVSVLYNTRACRVQANRRVYSSHENARRLFRHPSPVVVGSSSRMGIIAARHPGKFKDMTISFLAYLRMWRVTCDSRRSWQAIV